MSVEELIGKRFDVLDKGMIRVVDLMGDESSIVQAARVSYAKGTKTVRKDRNLIRYLIRHKHTSPIEMCVIKLHLKVPMDHWRQWVRHRTASINEVSTRYSEVEWSMAQTMPNSWRLQSTGNKQGSSGYVDEDTGADLSRKEAELHNIAREVYEDRLKVGIAREQARKDIPLSTYTEAYWKIDLHNLLHFLKLRMDHRAQKEIREYATIIGEQIVAKWCPAVWEAFTDYRLSEISLSRLDTTLVAAIISNMRKGVGLLDQPVGSVLQALGWCGKRSRERTECLSKLKELGIDVKEEDLLEVTET